ncbi:MAG: DNA-formamidopyrimidine glycosylase family protein [Propionibacteriaceae bacterium]|nr:DNA-formamidopyrimidine glycosylase family protein [Propionibacteriaceae bacterium]
MPELPEVEGIRGFLAERLTGRAFARVELASFTALKTFTPPLEALLGLEVDAVARQGKFLDVSAQGVHLVFHLARAGWLRWHDRLPAGAARPGKHGIALRVGFDDDSGFDLTEAGTQRRLAIYVANSPTDVPGVASLGPDPLSPDFTADDFAKILTAAGRAQLKGVLRDQSRLAGIGNAYSDEILHAARLSPFQPASGLDADARAALFGMLREVLFEAISAAAGRPPAELKDAKRSGMRVHGRTGQPCPVCQTPIAEVSFADSSLQYCPTCQTGGKKLADRRMSRLLR